MLQDLRNLLSRYLIQGGIEQARACFTWLEECMPPPIRKIWSQDPKELVLVIGEHNHVVSAMMSGAPVPVEPGYLDRARERWGPLISATLRVPLGRCLVRELELPNVAARQTRDILRIDLERTTPFKGDEVFFDWVQSDRQSDSGAVVLNQVILKRAVIGNVLDDIATSGLPLRAIEVVTDKGDTHQLNLLEPGRRKRAPATVWLGMTTLAGTVSLIVLSTVSIGIAYANSVAAIAYMDAAIDKATLEVQSVRRKLADMDAAATQARQPRLRKVETASVTAIWEEVTKVLPASTWLTDLRIEEAGIQIDGQSVNASELIAVLARTTKFTKVAFASPVTRDPQRGMERFQIKFKTSRSDAAAAGVSPKVGK